MNFSSFLFAIHFLTYGIGVLVASFHQIINKTAFLLIIVGLGFGNIRVLAFEYYCLFSVFYVYFFIWSLLSFIAFLVILSTNIYHKSEQVYSVTNRLLFLYCKIMFRLREHFLAISCSFQNFQNEVLRA